MFEILEHFTIQCTGDLIKLQSGLDKLWLNLMALVENRFEPAQEISLLIAYRPEFFY